MNDSRDPLHRLLALVARLRGPDGCPWDREQEIDDLRAYLLEEAHEVAAAIDSGNWDEICTELGDLLFQVVFVACLAEERAAFELTTIVDRIEAKMIARHPHVFGDEELTDSAAVHRAWEQRKLDDYQEGQSMLAGVPSSLPALLAAYRMTQKASGVGFDWAQADAVLDKVEEEISELRQELRATPDGDRSHARREELGDLLFTVANLARHLDLDPEAALAHANEKFRRRFAVMEADLADQGRSLADSEFAEMEAAWQRAKGSSDD